MKPHPKANRFLPVESLEAIALPHNANYIGAKLIMSQNSTKFERQLNNFGVSLHRAIINRLIGEIDAAIKDGRIRSQDERLSVYDFIGVMLAKKNARDAWKRLTDNVPGIVGFCDFISFRQKLTGRTGRKTPVTDMAGLIWIAYVADSEFSYNLRTSSSQLVLAERQSSSQSTTPIEQLEQSLEATRDALQNYPYTLDKLWQTSGIVNKSQVKGAILRDFVEGRDYTWADDLLCVNESTFMILVMSFRSLKGTDTSQLPEIIRVKTREYFQYHHRKKMNTRTGQADENQLSLF